MSSILPGVLPVVFLLLSCQTKTPKATRVENVLPPVILWAWERAEDLGFLDPHHFGVAFLSQTLVLQGDDVVLKPRHQPLKLAPGTKLIAVTRVEGQTSSGSRSNLTHEQRERVVTLISRTAELHNVSAIQVDFDAASSEREFYRRLLQDLRKKLRNDIVLSMTALASFCIGDRWLHDLPVDEAVPMIFRMGADDAAIKNFLASGNDFREPICRKSYGIAVDEPVNMKFAPFRRLYVFNARAWREKDVMRFKEGINR